MIQHIARAGVMQFMQERAHLEAFGFEIFGERTYSYSAQHDCYFYRAMMVRDDNKYESNKCDLYRAILVKDND